MLNILGSVKRPFLSSLFSWKQALIMEVWSWALLLLLLSLFKVGWSTDQMSTSRWPTKKKTLLNDSKIKEKKNRKIAKIKPVQLDGHHDWLDFDTPGSLSNCTCSCIKTFNDSFRSRDIKAQSIKVAIQLHLFPWSPRYEKLVYTRDARRRTFQNRRDLVTF